MIASHGGRAQFGESIGEALGKLFPGFDGDLGDRVGGPNGSERRRTADRAERRTITAPSCSPRADELLQEANDALHRRRAWPSTRPRSTRRRRPHRPGPRRHRSRPTADRRASLPPFEALAPTDRLRSTGPVRKRLRRARTLGCDDRDQRRTGLGQAGQVLAEGDLVAGLLAWPGGPARRAARSTAPVGGPCGEARRARGRARSAGWPARWRRRDAGVEAWRAGRQLGDPQARHAAAATSALICSTSMR